MKIEKITITSLLFAGTLIFGACSSMNTAEISVGLDKKSLSYETAKNAIANGANVKDGWTKKPFIQQAAEQERWDLVELFVENGASCFDAPGGYKYKPFSLFKYVTDIGGEESLSEKEIAMLARLDERRRAAFLERRSRDKRNTSEGNSIPAEMRLHLLDLCIAHKDADLAVANMQAREFVGKRINKESHSDLEKEILKRIENSGLAKEMFTKIIAERKEREAKNAEKAKNARPNAERDVVVMEKQAVLARLDKILESEAKLSAEDRSSGNALLEEFGNEQMPAFTKKYLDAREKVLETEAKINDLISELKAGEDPNKNNVVQVLRDKLRGQRVTYWTIRFKLTDYYSQFKTSTITTEKLGEADEKCAKLY